MLLSENVAQGNKKCVLCDTSFKWAGIFRGQVRPEAISSVLKVDELASVSVVKKSVYDNHKTLGADLEVIAKCPECHTNNKFNAVHVLHREEK